MSIDISDFFKPNEIKDISVAEDYIKIQPFVKTAEALSHITHQSIYIIDYYKTRSFFVSNNPIFMCIETAASVLKQGYLFYLNRVPDSDLELLREINEAGFKSYNNLPIEERVN